MTIPKSRNGPIVRNFIRMTRAKCRLEFVIFKLPRLSVADNAPRMHSLGFVTAILPELSLEEVLQYAAAEGFKCVEVMCWPVGKAERRYAGVTHIDVATLDETKGAEINALCQKHGVVISGLGYYPNPLVKDESEAGIYIEHLLKVISAAKMLGLKNVNTFVGREHTLSIPDNWTLFDERWPAIVRHAESCDVKIGIENCPMLFNQDEWPGGKNMAINPSIWREMFSRIPSDHFGLNYDPSHMIWQMMDEAQPIYEFADRLFHVHAKDVRVYRDKLNQVGTLATPLEFHQPKLPGLGQVNWKNFFAALTDIGYRGPVCIEVEDRAFEENLEDRKRSLRISRDNLKHFFG
jgi:sugar phosphate isomerase/epimerase